MANPFYDPKDIDDDEFLKHPRSGNSGYLLPDASPSSGAGARVSLGPAGAGPGPGFGPSTLPMDPAEQRRQAMLLKRREIEERTIDSSHRSLGLLYESEKVGQATAEELSRQKEQLLNTEQRLDEINSTLHRSERHLNGIKSIFGGIRNYFGASRGAAGGAAASPANPASSRAPAGMSGASPATSASSSVGGPSADLGLSSSSAMHHPGMRMRGLDGSDDAGGANSVNDRLDRNLDMMGEGLERLKMQAQNLHSELDDHNSILDRLDDKTSRTQLRVERQNQSMNKILKK